MCFTKLMMLLSMNVFSGYLPNSPRHNRFGVCLFSPRMCLQNLRCAISVKGFPIFRSHKSNLIINLIIAVGKVPDIWCYGLIIPVHKSGDPLPPIIGQYVL